MFLDDFRGTYFNFNRCTYDRRKLPAEPIHHTKALGLGLAPTRTRALQLSEYQGFRDLLTLVYISSVLDV